MPTKDHFDLVFGHPESGFSSLGQADASKRCASAPRKCLRFPGGFPPKTWGVSRDGFGPTWVLSRAKLLLGQEIAHFSHPITCLVERGGKTS